jgi:hypothetical protein
MPLLGLVTSRRLLCCRLSSIPGTIRNHTNKGREHLTRQKLPYRCPQKSK